MFITVDGVVESPDQWQEGYFNDEMGQAVEAQAKRSDTMLLGRQTYQEFASYWPQQGSDVEMADYMNNTPKLVASTTLTRVDWQNSTLVGGDVVAELTRIKSQPGRDISIVGSPTLVRSLLAARVLDELTLLQHPIVVGSGVRLFDGMTTQVPLTLRDAQTFSTGVQKLTYAPADA